MSNTLFSVGAIVIMLIIIIYMLLGSFLEHKHVIVGHESGIIILIGIAISFISSNYGHAEFGKMMTFDPNFFFYFCLPPIVFAAGYNMKRKKFFENFTNILLFGLFGTLIQFSFFSIFTYIVCSLDILEKYNGATG